MLRSGCFWDWVFILLWVLWASWICGFVSAWILEISQHYYFKHFFCFIFPFYCFCYFSYNYVKPFEIVAQFLMSGFNFLFVFLSCISVQKVSTDLCSSLLWFFFLFFYFFSHVVPIKSILHFCYYWFFSILFCFFLRVSISLVALPISSCMLSAISIRAFVPLIITILNLLPDNFNISVISESDSDDCFFFQTVFISCFLAYLAIFLESYNVGLDSGNCGQ